MISNLLTSLLIATAVGGTTATAFGNEPNKSIKITESFITTSEHNGDTRMTISIKNDGITPVEATGGYYKQISINQNISNNSTINIQDSRYAELNMAAANSLRAYMIEVVQYDVYAGYTVYDSVIASVLNYEIDFSSQRTVDVQIDTDWAIIDVSTTNEYYGLLNRSITNHTQYSILRSEIDTFFANALETGTYQNIYTYNETYIDDTKWVTYPDIQPTNERNNIMMVLRHKMYFSDAPVRLEADNGLTSINLDLTNGILQPVEPVDIPGMMYTVLTLPFSFVSQAFNLTIFPGTPYQLNFSNLVFAIVTILILLLIVKILMRFLR